MTDTLNNTRPEETETMTSRYERAQSLMHGIWTKKMTLNTTVYANWIGESECFWYERETTAGKDYRLVNASEATNSCAFDHAILAELLAESAQQEVNAEDLPIKNLEMTLDASLAVAAVSFMAFDKHWFVDLASNQCTPQDQPLPETEVMSPDGRYVAFARDHNLWVRDIGSNQETALTRDGEEDYVYAVSGSGWGFTMEPSLQVRWSPDSKRLFTVQRDTRRVKTLPVTHHIPKDGSCRPTVEQFKIAYPGDEHVETLRLLAIEVDSARIIEASYRQIPVTRNTRGLFTANLGWWSTDSRRVYFVDVERDYQTARVVEFDTCTGRTCVLFEETSDTHLNLMMNSDDSPTLLPLPDSQELIWFSERSGWAHLYLYDLETGLLKNAITQVDALGNPGQGWLVRYLVQYDPKRREVFVQTAGRSAISTKPDCERDPYYRDLVRVNIDTGEMVTLASGDHDCAVALSSDELQTLIASANRDIARAAAISPSHNFAVITRSRADEIPVTVLVDRDGNQVLDLETADISALESALAGHWQWPEPVKLRAADNKTDIYGLVFRPSDFSPDRSYPVVSHVFNTPELTWVSKGSFSNGAVFGWPYFDAAAMAELGCVVVQIDGRGGPFRSKAFLDESYGWVESTSNLDDHVAGIRQLAEQYSYMDLNRVGITSHLNGGSGAVQGLLHYPDFYKVGVTACLHDSRLLPTLMWGDKYEGVLNPAESSAAFKKDRQYPEQLVANLQGKLLLMHGMLDTTIPPTAMFRVIDELQKANKDFDMLLLPDFGHAVSNYLTRRTWDYLVRHLLDQDPPKEFKLNSAAG